jgi:hypothetical protein
MSQLLRSIFQVISLLSIRHRGRGLSGEHMLRLVMWSNVLGILQVIRSGTRLWSRSGKSLGHKRVVLV